ncbi:MAG: electron transport complex subunit RsxG [Pseudomonadota bacterium]|jgi:electron transport complex protein RnfG
MKLELFDAWRDRLSYQPLSLGIFALVASCVLSAAYSATKDHIAAAEQRDMRIMLAQVLPSGFADNDLLADTLTLAGAKGQPVKVHVAKKAGSVTGAVFQVAERGYAGDIVVLVAVDADGRVLGVRVLKHTETPGLGDKIEIAKARWIESFSGKSLGDPAPEKWGVKKDNGVFDQFTGATITPRAVVKAVKGGLEFFAAHRAEIIAGGKS